MPQTNERRRQLYRDDAEYRERMKRHAKEGRARHHADRLATERLWKANNPDRQARSVAAWHKANPERVREIKRRWEARNR